MDFHILEAIFAKKTVFFQFKSAQRAYYTKKGRCISELYFMGAFKHRFQSVGLHNAVKLIKAPIQSVQCF